MNSTLKRWLEIALVLVLSVASLQIGGKIAGNTDPYQLRALVGYLLPLAVGVTLWFVIRRTVVDSYPFFGRARLAAPPASLASVLPDSPDN